MADRPPVDVLDADEARLAAARPHRAAVILGRVLDPPWVVAFLLIVVTVTSTRDPRTAAWVLAVSLGGVVAVPYLLLWLAMRQGRASDRHVVRRRERPALYLGTLVSVASALTGLYAGGAPRPVLATLAGMCVGLLLVAAGNTITKVSFHVAVAAGAAIILLTTAPVLGTVLTALLPSVMWARVSEGRHSRLQVVAGAVLGALGAGTYLLIR
ncbi:MAG: hypothetical protein M0Z51_07830 [Propionibacterium sp.]|nr:hypothetical protein [Propionibacterium sp.]